MSLVLLIPSQTKSFWTKKLTVRNWQCCLKRRPKETSQFSAWGSTVDVNG